MGNERPEDGNFGHFIVSREPVSYPDGIQISKVQLAGQNIVNIPITGIPKSNIHEILTSHLHPRNFYVIWVPHWLSEHNKMAKIAISRPLVTHVPEGPEP